MSEPAAFAVSFVHLDDRVVMAVTGEVDMATAPEMQRALLDALEFGTADLVVDMSACRFIDCAGWGALMGVANTARALGGGITLRRPSRSVCRVRDLVGVGGTLATPPVPAR